MAYKRRKPVQRIDAVKEPPIETRRPIINPYIACVIVFLAFLLCTQLYSSVFRQRQEPSTRVVNGATSSSAVSAPLVMAHSQTPLATPPKTLDAELARPGLHRISPHGKVAPTVAASTEIDEVDYNNPNTGTQSTYELEVDRDANGMVERINFDDGGWKEVDGETVDNGDGTETYTDENGVEYIIHRSSSSLPGSSTADSTTGDSTDGGSSQ